MKITRNQGYIDLAINQRVSFELETDNLYHSLQLRLKGTFVITGSTVSGTPVEYNPISIIKRVEIIADGKDTIASAEGKDLYFENYTDNQLAGERVPITAGGNQTTPVFMECEVNFSDKTKRDLENMMIFNSTRYKSLMLYITFGNDTDLITGDNGAIALNNFTVDIISIEEDNLEFIRPLGIRKRAFNRQPILAGDNEIELFIGNKYNSILISAYDNGVLDNSIINTIQIIWAGQVYLVNAGFNQLRNIMVKGYKLSFQDIGNGYLRYKFDKDDNYTGLIPTRRKNGQDISSFKIKYNANTPTGTAYFQFMTDEVIDLGVNT